MARSRTGNVHGNAEPVFRGPPLFVRLSEAFVENLAQILRVGLIVGGLLLVQELKHLHELLAPTAGEPLATLE